MKKINALILLILASVTVAIKVQGQDKKKPKTQEVSVLAPSGIKIDGKLNEWDDKLLYAYNDNMRLFYVVCNDDKNLYFIIKGLGPRAMSKTIGAGLTFEISKLTDKKLRIKDKENIAVTFPYPVDPKTRFVLDDILMDQIHAQKQAKIDSFATLLNTKITTSLKQIGIKGIKEIQDSVISVYNSEGIRAAAQVEGPRPVYEIAIPLKYLGLTLDNPVTFSYNIKINGLSPNRQLLTEVSTGAVNVDNYYLNFPSDFWGTYKLISKNP